MTDEDKQAGMTGEETPQKVKINWNGTLIDAQIDPDGSLLVPQEVAEIMALGIDQAKKIAAAAETETTVAGTDTTDPAANAGAASNDVASNFKGLPMRELIANPLMAAAEAQEKLASVAWDFYKKIAYADDGKSTRVLEFTLDRPVVENGVVKSEGLKQTVKAPFIGLVPIPSLLIDRVDVDFQMEVTDTNSSTDKTETSATTDISAKWFQVNVGISGKVTSSRENTRSSNQTAKYQVHVSASQQPQTEGLSKLMDIMASCIEPVPTSGGS